MKLFAPIEIRGMQVRNRIWIPPMVMYSAENGVIGQWHVAHIGSFAAGGFGLIICEATAVTPEGRISTACAGIWNELTAEAWRPVVQAAHLNGAKVAIQLAHAGRKGSKHSELAGSGHADISDGGWQTVAPSAIAYGDYPMPHELNTDEVQEMVAAFVAAADRAIGVGFDAVEIHSAHGYLVHEFLSPLSNQRSDQYGGSRENHARFLFEIVQGIRTKLEVPLFVRISATDWAEGGWNLEDSVWLAAELKALGVDLVDVSTAGLTHTQSVPAGPHFQVPFAAEIRKQTGVLTSAVGLITDPAAAAEIVESGQADVVMIGRAALRNPHWAWFAAQELDQPIEIAAQYRRGRLK